jgi:hypothetical protein
VRIEIKKGGGGVINLRQEEKRTAYIKNRKKKGREVYLNGPITEASNVNFNSRASLVENQMAFACHYVRRNHHS